MVKVCVLPYWGVCLYSDVLSSRSFFVFGLFCVCTHGLFERLVVLLMWLSLIVVHEHTSVYKKGRCLWQWSLHVSHDP